MPQPISRPPDQLAQPSFMENQRAAAAATASETASLRRLAIRPLRAKLRLRRGRKERVLKSEGRHHAGLLFIT
ncbi:hypothetical protein CIT31_11300 [Mesorhizobium wenxiniae]|uniref:Uncharacterized protein n=1 Tax=Mesorhizobium wenxiniae TaxID=2014805 RepID=A0A271KG18_9HYPH|nr:hypothetical protein CIT31_11300 [Mesorhizobium wenxiniae]